MLHKQEMLVFGYLKKKSLTKEKKDEIISSQHQILWLFRMCFLANETKNK